MRGWQQARMSDGHMAVLIPCCFLPVETRDITVERVV